MASVGTIKYKNGSSWIDILHPVGSFHLSTSSTSPANLFGGTWSQITNAALRGSTSVGYTGSDTHTLTINEMPSHQHQLGQDGDMDFGYSYNASSGDKVYYGRYSSGGRPLWKLTSFNGGGQHTQSCNAPTIFTSGTEQRKSKRVVVM